MSRWSCLALLALLVSVASTASADKIYTVVADSTMDGNAGTLVTVQEPGSPAETMFLFPQANMIRVYAIRDAGSPTWTVQPAGIYQCPKNNIAGGATWRFLDDEGNETVAEAIGLELVNTPAGIFNAWRVDVALASSPTKVERAFWFADDVGLVRQVEYFDQWIEWEALLDSYTVTGNGYFPLVVGNTWTVLTAEVATEPSSLSAIKGQYRGH